MGDVLWVVCTVFCLTFGNVSCGSVLELGNNDFETAVGNQNLVLVNFYAKWCKFSRMLDPIFDEAAKHIIEAYPENTGSVRLAKVDSEKESEVAKKYGINKYPTIKVFKNGKVQKREYRGSRSKEAFLEYVKKQMESPVKEITNLDDIPDLLDSKKHNMIGYFTQKDSNEFRQFDKVAGLLRDDCGWFAAFGDVAESQKPGGGYQIVYKPPSVEHQEKLFSSSMKNHELFLHWAQDKCVPLVRVITFENAEELTEEGIPFLILFHHPDDIESPKKFSQVVQSHLMKEKEGITFLTADGLQFAHPLHHMGKQAKDLPVLAIDSFKHMYVFPDNSKMFDPDALLMFIRDLHTGKLHREFHHGPDPTAPPRQPVETRKAPSNVPQPRSSSEEPPQAAEDAAQRGGVDKQGAGKTTEAPKMKKSTPPESQFVKLGPSDLRYSFNYKDEL